MVIGYLRVSTGKQNLANQQNEIRRFADSKDFVIDSWVTEVVSGRKRERDRKLGTLLKRMKPGDTLIVTEIVWPGRSISIQPRRGIRSTIPSTAKSFASLSDWWRKSSAI